MHIEGLIEFPNAIPVRNECLGRQYQIKTGDENAIIETPVLLSDEPTEFQKLLKPKSSRFEIKDSIYWGTHTSIGVSIIDAFAIYLELPDIAPSELNQDLFSALSKWFKYFIENLSVLSGYDLVPPYHGISDEPSIQEANEFHLSYQAKSGLIIKLQSAVTFSLRSPLYLDGCSLEHFNQGVAATNDGRKPCLEYYFLLDSNRAITERNYRKSILDASTSLEICFANLIRERLPGDEDFKGEILNTYNSLSKRRKLLEFFGINLPRRPNDYGEKVERLRNRSIHAGYNPTLLEAKDAYSLVKETLDKLVDRKFE